MELADLHTHSTYSDGRLEPLQVAALAKAAGLRAFALTDHDSMEGLRQLAAAVEVEVIPGIERKAFWRGREIHILGYDGDWAQLRSQPAMLEGRATRNAAMVAKLQAAGVSIAEEELYAGQKGTVGRPRIAALLVEKGYFSDVNTAFQEWLGEGRPFYAPLAQQTPDAVIGELRQAGARPVLAHPLQYGLPREELKALAAQCRESGALGMECVYSGYTRSQQTALLELAEACDLSPTGGSDFHGPHRPERVVGGAAVPYRWLAALRERAL